MSITHHEAETYLFKPGDEIDHIFFISEGKIEISFTLNDKNLTMAMLNAEMINEEERVHFKDK